MTYFSQGEERLAGLAAEPPTLPISLIINEYVIVRSSLMNLCGND